MTSSEASKAQTYRSFTLPSRSIGLSTREADWAGIPLVVSLLPFVPSILFLFLFPSLLSFFSLPPTLFLLPSSVP